MNTAAIVHAWANEFCRCDEGHLPCDLHYVPQPRRERGADQETLVDILIERLKQAQP